MIEFYILMYYELTPHTNSINNVNFNAAYILYRISLYMGRAFVLHSMQIINSIRGVDFMTRKPAVEMTSYWTKRVAQITLDTSFE